jgi:hypothetical protein
MALHDPDAWRRLDMAYVRRQMQEPESIRKLTSADTDDGIFLIPLVSRRIYQCGHYFTLWEMLINEGNPLAEEVLVTRACTTSRSRRDLD